MNLAKTVGKIFLLALFIWGLFVGQMALLTMTSQISFEAGVNTCTAPQKHEAGGFLPYGVTEAISLETPIHSRHTS